jgi:hypothetical protein
MTGLVLAAAVAPVLAQDGPAPAPPAAASPAVEITPFVAMGSNGSSPIGAAVSFPLSPSFSIEAEVGYRRGEGDINALSSSANLLYSLPRVGRTDGRWFRSFGRDASEHCRVSHGVSFDVGKR